MAPPGAPDVVILRRLQQDPTVKRDWPNLSMKTIWMLHRDWPQFVPEPGVSTLDNNGDGLDFHLERIAKVWAANGDISNLVNESYQGEPVESDGNVDLRQYHSRFFQSDLLTCSGFLEVLGEAGLFLRRIILNAPSHWGNTDIAEEFNHYLDYVAAIASKGNVNNLESEKERLRLDADQVEQIRLKYPYESGSLAFIERKNRLLERLFATISHTEAGANLYDVLCKVDDRQRILADDPGWKRGVPDGKVLRRMALADGYDRDKREFTKPVPDARIEPEDLIKIMAGNPAYAKVLDKFLANRCPYNGQEKAEQILHTFGSKIGQWSVRDIAKVMQRSDLDFSETRVRHLLSGYPEIFGLQDEDRFPLENKFLLARKVANIMEHMFEGATLDDVAKLINTFDPVFANEVGGVTAADIHLIQQAYDFVPSWQVNGANPVERSASRSSLTSFIQSVARDIGQKAADHLLTQVFSSLSKNVNSKRIPLELQITIDTNYQKAALAFVDTLFPEMKVLSPEQQVQLKGKIEEVSSFDHETLKAVFTESGLPHMSLGRAGQIATALVRAKRLDFSGLRASVETAPLAHSHEGEIAMLRLDSLSRGYEALLTRLERDIMRDEDLRASLKRSSLVTLRSEMVQKVVAKYHHQQPLKNCNVMMVQHMLGQAYSQISGYQQLGMDCCKCIFVGIPYHKNPEVEEAVAQSFGVDVRVPPRDMHEMCKAIERGVDDAVAMHRKNGLPILIVCDGPQARDYFEMAYPELAEAGVARFTEQTSYGDRPEHRAKSSMRVVSYALLEPKEEEAKFVGQAVARAVNGVLSQLGTGGEKKPILILGAGDIGLSTADAFAGDGGEMYIYDNKWSPEAEAYAKSHGYTILKDRANIAKGKFMLVGCAGDLTIDMEEILSSDSNAIYVSASSKLVEINMEALRKLSIDDEGRVRRFLVAEVNNQQTWAYWLTDGTLRIVVADGLPANFNDVNSVPPEFIDLTMAMSLASAVQAVNGTEIVFESLNATDTNELNDMFNGMLNNLCHDAREAAAASSDINGS
ncbi:MAG: hypothetical protein A2289_21930 [Deltaproteobacteria bacterium RIFOXYA12_FULL_58_15]|nr:MAG: hypothetical protein A2289_21930 [Deltaproteobacteria bacterium RIFOXYA12_FULL_58_15]OGR09140.1 MAG: hypothetical protein A2341_10820 [Deltaproteobacteria bacterium RIFOXYB12_FULL_58_9]